VRVPLTNSSITDAVFEVKRNTSAEEVNDLLREAAGTYLKNILQVRTSSISSAELVELQVNQATVGAFSGIYKHQRVLLLLRLIATIYDRCLT
jgi:glyceraldehyde-3-phosphate dehydrogenase/erythrose-4-phosphate dehydrogenase